MFNVDELAIVITVAPGIMGALETAGAPTTGALLLAVTSMDTLVFSTGTGLFNSCISSSTLPSESDELSLDPSDGVRPLSTRIGVDCLLGWPLALVATTKWRRLSGSWPNILGSSLANPQIRRLVFLLSNKGSSGL